MKCLNRLKRVAEIIGKTSQKYKVNEHEHPVRFIVSLRGMFFKAVCRHGSGTDSRVRLWDIESGCNTLVNYEATRIRSHPGNQLAVSMDSSLLFVASSHSIQVITYFFVCESGLGLHVSTQLICWF